MFKRNIKIKRKKMNKIVFYSILSFFVLVFVAGKDGFVHIISFYQKISILRNQAYDLEKEKIELEKEIYRLNKDDEYIESIAREQLGMIKEGEEVYKFVDINKNVIEKPKPKTP
ncbi:septum formation initiator family protein [Candidatus Poribacteria bacterium]|nr:septum formation initiator family protein [Candidatus Poribacteria bacterium]